MRKVVLLISLEGGLICIAVVVNFLTGLFPIWAWAAGAVVFVFLIPLGLYHREFIAFVKRRGSRVNSHGSPHPSVQPTPYSSVDQTNNELAAFKGCLPHIERSRKLIRPYAGTTGVVGIAQHVLQGGSDVFAEIAAELEFLSKKLSALGIYTPVIWGEEGNDSLQKVHLRLRAWSTHLAWLEAKIHQEDLQGVRFQEE